MANPINVMLSPADARRTIRELLAASVISPGMLLERSSATQFDVHGVAAGNAQKIFALENVANAEGLADDYASGETVRGVYAQSGDEVYSVVAAMASAIVVGDPLESAGDGTLRKHTPQAVDEGGAATYNVIADSVVAYAQEAVDNSAASAVARIRVEVA